MGLGVVSFTDRLDSFSFSFVVPKRTVGGGLEANGLCLVDRYTNEGFGGSYQYFVSIGNRWPCYTSWVSLALPCSGHLPP